MSCNKSLFYVRWIGDILPLQIVCQLLQTQQIMLNKASALIFI